MSIKTWPVLTVIVLCFMFLVGCGLDRPQQTSDSGVVKTSTEVQTDTNGQTVEQTNIIGRIKEDTTIGSVKHLYVISSYSGDVLEYSTVKGKVTSGGKRLSPRTVSTSEYQGMSVGIGQYGYRTGEVIDEYGTYGDSGTYFYWFDVQGSYHQYFPSGGTYVHISNRPLKPKKAIVTFEPAQ